MTVIFQNSFERLLVKWTGEQHHVITPHRGHLRRVGILVCDAEQCEFQFGAAADFIAENTFAYSKEVCIVFICLIGLSHLVRYRLLSTHLLAGCISTGCGMEHVRV
jgi:hypothetical protein